MNKLVPFNETLELIKQRDPKSWSDLIKRSKNRMTSYICRYSVFSYDDIADLISETFVVLLRRLEEDKANAKLKFEVAEQLDAYLLAIFIKLTYNALRKKTREIKLYLPIEQLEPFENEEENQQTLPSDSYGAIQAWFDNSDNVDESERITQMKRALNSLPDKDRELLLLWAQGYDYKSLIEILKIDAHQQQYLKVKLYRIRQAIFRWFEEHTKKIDTP